MKNKLILLLAAVIAISMLACAKEPDPTQSAPDTRPTAVPTQPHVPTAPTTVPTEPTTVPTEPTTVPTESRYPFDAEEADYLFGLWQSELTVDEEMLGLPGLGKSFKLTVYVEFDDLGMVYTYVDKTEAEAAFNKLFDNKNVRKFVKNACYAQLEEQGYSKKEAEEMIKQTYGMTMDEYVDLYIETVRDTMDFEGMSTNTHYYAEGNDLYVLSPSGVGWEEYSIEVRDGKMTIQEAVSPDGEFFLIGSAQDLPKKLSMVTAGWG